jgi:hypothetical protein
MNTISRSAVVLGLGLLTLPGCPLVDAEVDAQEVCLTYPNFQVPAVAGGDRSLQQSFVFDDLSSVKDLTKLDANVQFVRAEVRATSGIQDFNFIHSAKLVVSSGDPDSELLPMTMYNCDGDCVPDGDHLEIPAALGNDAIEYLRSNSIKIDVELKGNVPSIAWTMDIDVCLKARASYTL